MFAYSIYLSCGIVSAYFILEAEKLIWGSFFLVSLELILLRIGIDDICVDAELERKILTCFMISGFMLFTFKSISMNGSLYNEEGVIQSPSEITKVTGVVRRIEEKDDGCRFIIRPESIKGVKQIQVSYYDDPELLSDIYSLPGAEITVYGELKVPEAASNFGCFNYRLYMYSHNIRFTMSAKYIDLIAASDSVYWNYRKYICRTRDLFLSYFDEEERGFIKGVIFGDKSDISDDTINEFNENSTGHILAVSGLHIGFLFALLKVLTGKRRSRITSGIVILVVFLYGEMTAWSPSTIRAVTVASLSLCHIYFEKPFDLLSAISTSAVLILISNPYQLFSSGFQMSLLALLGICFLTEPISHFTGEGVAVLLAVQIAVTPVIIYYFCGFNPISIFINIPIIFLASILVPFTIILLMLTAFSVHIPAVFITAMEGLADSIVRINRILNFEGCFFSNIKVVSTGLIVLLYILLFFISSEWFRVMIIRGNIEAILRCIPCILIPVMCISVMTFNIFQNDEIIFVSVGQGDSVHISADGHNILIDGGGSENYNVGENILKQYLLKNGVNRLDLALLTHLHTDHYLGIFQLNNVFPIGKIGIPYAYSEADDLPDNALVIREKYSINMSDDVRVDVIWPIESTGTVTNSDEANENNTVYMIYYGDFKILVTGDLIEEDEHEMISYYRESDILKADILKVGHHGSKTSTSEEFLDAVDPEIAVIQVGLNNMYGHPAKQTLTRLSDRGIKIYRTDINGEVGLDLRKKSIHVDTMH